MASGAFDLLVGCVQVVALAGTAGGTLLVWFLAQRGQGLAPAARRQMLLRLAEKYERWFWLALGLLLLARFGSLAALRGTLPAPASGWGFFLVLTVAGVVAFLALAGLRTLLLIQLSLVGDDVSARLLRLFPWVYGGTGLGLVGLVLLALAWVRTWLLVPGA